MSINFKKRTRNVRKSKKIKIVGERVSLISLVMQISLALGEKIPSSSVRSLSPKSSLCFFVRGPIGPRRRRWRKTGWSRTQTVFKRCSQKKESFFNHYWFYSPLFSFFFLFFFLEKSSHWQADWANITTMSTLFNVGIYSAWVHLRS